jgi:orotidine-5'-phosphate decarboxylase
MERRQLIELIKKRESFLCIGLDPDMDKIPEHLLDEDDPVFSFNKQIIDATRNYCVAYKPNLAFYECLGAAGWTSFEKTIAYIGTDHFIIADAKRADIGNTSRMYARAFFESVNCDAVTIAPYMGSDSVQPFLETEGKWAILLALTSNKGADDFQMQYMNVGNDQLFEQVLKKSKEWGSAENLMYVAGATRPELLAKIRKIVPHHFLLVPGVGAQGGSLQAVAESGLNSDVGLLVNSSRSIIYAGSGKDFASASAKEAKAISDEMATLLERMSILK